MEIFESWKELVLKPDLWLSKNKGPLPLQNTVALVVLASLCSSAMAAFGQLGPILQGLLKISPLEILAYFALFSAVFTFLGYYMVHLFARALGGKGSFQELISIPIHAAFPFLLVSTVLYFVPYVGQPLSMLVGLISLIVLWVVYKVLRLRYCLSVKRAIAAYIAGHLVNGIIGIAVIVGLAYFAFMSFVESGSFGATVTETAGGYHLYNPGHGGYSFDYGADWESFVWNASGSEKMLQAFMQNDFISTEMIRSKEGNRTVMVLFMPPETEPISDLEAECLGMLEQNGDEVDFSQAKASVVQWGGRQGCLAEGVRDRETGGLMLFYNTFECGSNTVTIAGADGDRRAVAQIASTLECGQEAAR